MFVSHLLILFLNFLFYIGVQLINNVVIVSGGRQSDSVIHVHVSILFQILSPFRLLGNTEQNSLCLGSVDLCWSSILYFLKNFLLYIEVQLINKQCCDCFR